MKKLLILAAASALGAALSASAQVVQLTFDENGNASGISGITSIQGLDNHGASVVLGPLTGSSVPSGGNATTLDYLFAAGSSTWLEYGWVAIYDPHGGLSDLIHFDNSIGVGGNQVSDQMFFYSNDHGQAADNWVGDSTLTSILGSANLVKITENASGIAYYNPAVDGAAFGESAPGVNLNLPFNGPQPASTQYTYEFVSSGTPVPEPTTFIAGALLLLPFGASTLRMVRKKRAA